MAGEQSATAESAAAIDQPAAEVASRAASRIAAGRFSPARPPSHILARDRLGSMCKAYRALETCTTWVMMSGDGKSGSAVQHV